METNTITIDKIEKFGDCILQHGTLSDRIYLMKYAEDDFPEVLERIEELAAENEYSKVFAKVPSSVLPSFIRNSWEMEAFIPSYFSDDRDAVFVSRFYDPDRKVVDSKAIGKMNDLLSDIVPFNGNEVEETFEVVELQENNAEEISEVYRTVFESYPFPIHDPSYIQQTMQENFRYFGIFDSNRNLAGVSSSEIDFENKAVEMTDFAVDPIYRGQGLALHLLTEMENEMTRDGMKTFFTIARLNSQAMNKTFLKLGYNFSGTLVNNTNICGQIESMNVYYKKAE